MTSRESAAILVLLAAAAAGHALMAQAASSSDVVIAAFGDSLTDTGIIYAASAGFMPRSPYYWQGRFTNAYGNWQDHINGLETSAVSTVNRAVGGSMACRKSTWSVTALIPTALEQAGIFLIEAAVSTNGSLAATLANKTVVPLIWAGHNDLLAMDSLSLEELAVMPQSVATCILAGAELLLGSKLPAIKHVVVGTVAPLELTPYARDNRTVADIVGRLNDAIRQGVKDLQAKLDAAGRNQSVVLWDAHNALSELIPAYAEHGFMFDNTKSCLLYKPNTSITRGDVPYYMCPDPEAYLFMDSVHPTSLAHLYIAENILSTMAQGGALPSRVLPGSRRQLRARKRGALRHRRVARRLRAAHA